MGNEEGILYAECNLEIGIQMKLRHDFAGHYNRPDIFHLQINRSAPPGIRVIDHRVIEAELVTEHNNHRW